METTHINLDPASITGAVFWGIIAGCTSCYVNFFIRINGDKNCDSLVSNLDTAATLVDVVEFYDQRFAIGFTEPQKADLALCETPDDACRA